LCFEGELHLRKREKQARSLQKSIPFLCISGLHDVVKKRPELFPADFLVLGQLPPAVLPAALAGTQPFALCSHFNHTQHNSKHHAKLANKEIEPSGNHAARKKKSSHGYARKTEIRKRASAATQIDKKRRNQRFRFEDHFC
jgi:hypothetical protein